MRTFRCLALALSFTVVLTPACRERRRVSAVVPAEAAAAAPASQLPVARPALSPAPPLPPSPAGPLTRKAEDFERLMETMFTAPHGLVGGVEIDPATGLVRDFRVSGDSCIWTGVYAGTLALRYKLTRQPADLQRLERVLWALHRLHDISGYPGLLVRGYDDAARLPQGQPAGGAYAGLNFERGNLSRDQYTGWFYGLALAWDEIHDPALRDALRADAQAIAENLMRNDLALRAPSYELSTLGQMHDHFNLNPDYAYQDRLTPQNWATVDDFPFNLITKAVPYDPQLATALKAIQIPPVRGGEALRALMFFTVALEVTRDPGIADYRSRVLLGQKGLLQAAERYGNLVGDALAGRNLVHLRTALDGLARSLAQFLQLYLQVKGSTFVLQLLGPPLAQGLGLWLSGVAVRLLDYLQQPANQQRLQVLMGDLRLLSLILDLVGLKQAGTKLRDFITQYGQNLHAAGLAEAADAQRSYVGTNLVFTALAGLLHIERDPPLRLAYQGILERQWADIADEQNAWFNLIHAGWGPIGGPYDVFDSLRSLRLHPTDLRSRHVDHSSRPGVVPMSWPDRFGKRGNLARDIFPLDERPRHVFIWQEPPRVIVGGVDSDEHFAPLGYLAAYWVGRHHGAISVYD